MVLLGVAVVLVGLAGGAPAWFVVASAAVTGVLAVLGSRRRERRRREQYRRWREWAEQAERELQARKAARQAARRQAVKQRTGLDVDLVAAAVRDLTTRSGERVRAVGERLNGVLESRYGRAAAQVPAEQPSPSDGRPDWLDLDTDLAALEARRRTDEVLRLNEQLGDHLRARSSR
ncbi:MAG: hypothetical protein ACTHMS_01540 [Jatrophihabitans sp.]|uniref:hypothetical protein n=1 Tax=Jatrophihabitans sp. TaxID=1932789 RepID=UPI003F7D3076